MKTYPLNQARLISCYAYLHWQRDFYIESLERLEVFYEWLRNGDTNPDDLNILTSYAPDICGHCLKEFGLTQSGRVRLGCYNCLTKPWSDYTLKYYWITGMTRALQCDEALLEFYIAKALKKIKETRNAH